MNTNNKPPLGLIPRDIHTQERALEILAAMGRYVGAGKAIPREWISELGDLYEAV